MPDIIQLLPETVANQIAAGEVIQRPASAVKELLENSVDAGSTRIEVYVTESGKELIRIIDNGSGMSVTDARLSFSRHATSKIREANDLFSIRTMGFRGEALASIASIAHVELRTRLHAEDIGTSILIEGNEFKGQQAVSTPPGTSISVKNLFYNVPARRNFLKSNSVEARHIIDEFERVALSNPSIAFTLNLNGIEVFKLPSSNLRQRIVNINGSQYNERLVPVEESTSLISIHGFVGKPEFSRKKRGEQYFFVNNRFIKDNYLHHAVNSAFEELLPHDSYPSYWLYINIDPSRIDVNIHPTKTEIKFEDERALYAIVRAAVKRALGQYSVSPALDFERESRFDVPHSMRYQPARQPGISVNPGFNPFEKQHAVTNAGWQKVYEDIATVNPVAGTVKSNPELPVQSDLSAATFMQWGPYIVSMLPEGIMFIDANAAHERILYDQFIRSVNDPSGVIQQELFPQTLTFSPADATILKEIEPAIRRFGFDLREFGLNTFVLHGTPSGVERGTEKEILDRLIGQHRDGHPSDRSADTAIASALARNSACPRGSKLSPQQMHRISSAITRYEKPTGLSGKPCMIILKTADITERFK